MGKKPPLAFRDLLLLNLSEEKEFFENQFTQINWHCLSASSIAGAKKIIINNDIDLAVVIISSATAPQLLKTLTELREIKKHIHWLAISTGEQPSNHQLPLVLSSYFTDYHHQPINWQKLGDTLGHTYGMAKLAKQFLQDSNVSKQAPPQLLGQSAVMVKLRSDVHKIAATGDAVLISGETGTGKGVCAQLIHQQSSRRDGPFITINCGALPATLIHSELFGHEKGAFTGADKQYIGHIERAHMGTLFLDEIGDLSLSAQINLLHFLENHVIERLGGSKALTIDCRLIFASHVNLELAIDEGSFREDLYYRLNILRIHVPSLRERKVDIELLSNQFLNVFQSSNDNYSIKDSTLSAMLQYDWPGNVRELINRIHRAVVMADNKEITTQDMGISSPAKKPFKVKVALKRAEINADTEVLLDAIEKNNHNITAAAKYLNISRTTFYRLIKKCKIQL